MKKLTTIALCVAAMAAGCDNRPLLGRLADGGGQPMDGATDAGRDGEVPLDGDLDGGLGDGAMGDGSVTDGGACVAPRMMCGEECVDPNSDPAHCGGCDMACPMGMGCSGGTCETCGDDGETCCGDTCAAGLACGMTMSCAECGSVGEILLPWRLL